MKLRLLVCLLPFASILQGADIDLNGKAPEDYDWPAYFAKGGHSTASEMLKAQAAADLLQQRIDKLCTWYRALMTKRGDLDAAKKFDEMQVHWTKSATAEVQLVGNSWIGGTGAKVAYPMHRFRVNLRRVRELNQFEGDCLFLNE